MRLAQPAGDPRISHDVAEMIHQVGFRHHRQRRDIGLGKVIHVESGQPLAVPRRTPDRSRQQFPERTQSLGPNLIPRPARAPDMLRQQLLETSDMTPAQCLTRATNRKVHVPILAIRVNAAHPRVWVQPIT